MKELFQKIYDNVICYEQDTIEMDKEVGEAIEDLIRPYQGKISEDERESLKNLLYGAAMSGERKGFLLGARYTVKALMELLE